MAKFTSPEFINSIMSALSYWEFECEPFAESRIIQIDEQKDTLYSVIEHGLALPETQVKAAELVVTYFKFIERLGYWQDWLGLVNKALQSSHLSIDLKIRLLLCKSAIANIILSPSDMIQLGREALEIAQANQMPLLQAQSLYYLALGFLDAYSYEQAIDHAEKALGLFEQFESDSQLILNLHNVLGVALYSSANYEPSFFHFSQTIMLAEELNLSATLCNSYVNMSKLLVVMNKFEDAKNILSQADLIARRDHLYFEIVSIQIQFGIVFVHQKEWLNAEDSFRKAYTPYLQKSSNYKYRAMVNCNIGYVLLKQEKYDVAQSYLREAANLWRDLSNEIELANTLVSLAESKLGCGLASEAISIYEEAIIVLAGYPKNKFAQEIKAKAQNDLAQLEA